jgi:hypothetical protein
MTQRERGPAPTDAIEHLFWGWASIDNGDPRDDDRFYECIVRATAHKPEWTRANVEGLLRRFGLREEIVEKRGRDFWIGRCALKKRENMERGLDETVF